MAAQTTQDTNYEKDIFESNFAISTTDIIYNWFKELLRWWYITTPVWYVLSLRRVLTIIDDQFSISILITNFFVPWHRDYTFVGLFVGIIMKILFLPIGIFVFLLTLISYLSFIILWTILPIITIFGILITPFLNLIN